MTGTPMAREHCPECGAPRVDGLSCWEQLGGIIAWEWQDPALLAEHFLTVATYNLQHPAQFTDAALAGLQAVYIAYLDEGIPIAEVRKRVGKEAKGTTPILKPEAARQPCLRSWPMTIANVYLPEQPQGAAARVRAWAVVVRRELGQ